MPRIWLALIKNRLFTLPRDPHAFLRACEQITSNNNI